MDNPMRGIDMSSEALDLRLRQLSGLHKLGLSLQKAKLAAAPASRDSAAAEFVGDADRDPQLRQP